MNLTAARNTWHERTRMGDTLRVPMADDAIIYQGGMVCVDANGYAVAARDAANYKMIGVATTDPQHEDRSTYDNTNGGDGGMFVVVRNAGRFRFKYLAAVTGLPIVQAMMCAMAFVVDDQTLCVHEWDAVNDVWAGVVCRLPAATLALDPHADFDSDEIEIELYGEPFLYDPGVTTTTGEPTTTTTQQGI
jgi:hypothetical protein